MQYAEYRFEAGTGTLDLVIGKHCNTSTSRSLLTTRHLLPKQNKMPVHFKHIPHV